MTFKHLFIFLQILTTAHWARAQGIFPDHTQKQKWEYVTWNFWGGQCERRIIKNGDRIDFCGRQYIKIWDCNEAETDCSLIGYYRIQHDSVLVRTKEFIWNGTDYVDSVDCSKPEGLMFDFGVSDTDTLICEINSTHPPTFTGFWKTQEQTLTYEGTERQTLSMAFRPYPVSPFIVYSMDWIAGIGSNVHPFYSLTCIGDHCEWEQQLTRVFRDDALIYQDTVLNFSFPCTGWISATIEPTRSGPSMSLFPNPTSSGFYIKSDFPLPVLLDVLVYDQLGRLLFRQLNHPREESVRLDGLTPGPYYVHIRGEGISNYSRLIKQ